ncbi:MAG TPA: hypothetical protein DCG34_12150 [Clostridiales bacterium]|nr:hypothetical protein [Clostridiales bacterium]
MNSGEAYRKLFTAFKEGDDEDFMRVSREIIKDEQSKYNNKLVDDLQKILDIDKSSPRKRSTKKDTIINNIPRDAEKGLPLLEIKTFKKDFSDLIIEKDKKKILGRIVLENKKLEILSSHSLEPIKKVLFYGPLGCGKTLAAEILCSDLSYPMAYIRFDGLVSSYLGATAANLRKVFSFVENGNWVVFFDEFDLIGAERDSSLDHGEIRRVVNSFLQMIDNFKGNSILIAATNHQHLLDSALWRRFDEVVYFDLPDKAARKSIFKKYLLSARTRGINLDYFAEISEKMSPSDIEAICLRSIKEITLSSKKLITPQILESSTQEQLRKLNHKNGSIVRDNGDFT